MITWIKDRLKEPSTYQGIVVLLGAMGIAVSPDALFEIGVGVAMIIGGIQMIKKDNAEN